MRNPQSLPEGSPATQPYNQGVKPAFTMQQPMGLPAAGNVQLTNNPNTTGFDNQQSTPQSMEPVTVSPTPGYALITSNNGMPEWAPTMANQSQPVTPTSLYSSSNTAMSQASGEEQKQNNQSHQQPVTPPSMQFAMAPGTNSQENWDVSSNEVASPVDNTGGATEENCFDDLFGGPPMGGTSPVGGSGLAVADLTGATVGAVLNSTDNQYQGVVQGMGALTVSPPEQQHQQYQNYAAPPPQQHGYVMGAQQQGAPVPQADPWGVPQQQQQVYHQPYNQQQAAYPPASNWNSFAQQPPQPQPQQQQQQQQPSPVQDPWAGGNFAQNNQLPSLNHSPQAHGGQAYDANPYAYSQQANAYDTTSYNDGESEEPNAPEPERAVADHKSSADVMREYGAGLRALRLLDETTSHLCEEDEGRVSGGSLRKAMKHEQAKSIKAKQLRKMKKLEYKQKKAGQLAESSRGVTSVRRGYDPDLNADKCQLDFDRARDAQAKALKLMSMF